MEEKEEFIFPFPEDYLPQEQQITSSTSSNEEIPPDVVIHVLSQVRRSHREFDYRWSPACGLSLRFNQGLGDFSTFADLVAHVLSLLTGTINSFQISVYLVRDESNKDKCRRVSNWLIQAIRFGATSLEVSTSCYDGRTIDLCSDFISSCHGLELLQIHECGIQLPELSVELLLPRLVQLDLYSCKFEEGGLQRLVASCPSLRRLQVLTTEGVGNLEFDLPNLQVIRLTGLTIDNISFKHCPHLQEVHIDLYTPYEHTDTGSIQPPGGVLHLFYGTCSLIQSLELGRYTLKKLSRSHVPHKFGWQFKCLKYIMFRMDLGSVGEISVALCIFRSAPILDRLHVSADKEFTKESGDLHRFWGSKGSLDCSLGQLTDVSIHNLRLEYPHLEFCRFLLATTPALQSFYAEAWIGGTDVGEYEIRQRLKSYDQIASPHVNIW